MKKLVVYFLLSFSFLFAQGKVAVAIFPLEYAAEKIILGKMNIVSLFNEEYFRFNPSRKNIRAIAGMSVYFTLNLPREIPLIKKIKEINPYLNIVDLTEGLELIKTDGKINPYVWLDPVSYRKIVETMHKNIVKFDAINKDYYDKNLSNFLEEIDNIFLGLKKKLYSTRQENFFVYGDYWDYFARRYNLNLYKQKKRIVKAEEIHELISFTKQHDIEKILVSASDNTYYAQSLSYKTRATIVKHNIFAKNWDSNLFVLTNALIK